MKTPTQGRTSLLASGVLLPVVVLFVSLRTLRGVDGRLAAETSFYSDTACEDSVLSFLDFGVTDTLDSGTFHDYNECIAYAELNASVLHVCDVTTGETGSNLFGDTTCTELTIEGAAVPSCLQLPAGAECTTAFCTQVTECTDTVASTISPGVVNFLAGEYNDANCTDPTGNTVILSGDNIAGQVSGECHDIGELGGYAMGECRADGSYIAQYFSPEDDTCSGDVRSQVTGSPTEFAPPRCITTAVDGLYYGYTSCTTDNSTLSVGTSATIAPTEMGTDAAVATPVPTPDVDDDAAATATAAPTNGVDDNPAADTPAPTADVDDDILDNTSAPAADDGSRGISVTESPTAAGSGSGEVEETPSPIESDEAETPSPIESALANGVARTGSGVAVGIAVLSCAVGLLIFVTV